MVKFNTTFTTSGDGYWSRERRTVQVTHIEVPYVNDEQDFGELCVYFDTKTWDVDQHGLIYTDKRFLAELKAKLAEIGFPTDVDYSEQGMQGDTYVSLDVGPEFLRFWLDATDGVEV